MRTLKLLNFLFFILLLSAKANALEKITITVQDATGLNADKEFYKPSNSLIQYYGRIQNADLDLPRFWSPGVYIKLKIDGNKCSFILNDQVLYGNVYNYIELVIDGKQFRFQNRFKANLITIHGLQKTTHNITICKDTESSQGYLEFAGVSCKKLLPLPAKPPRKIEFIGNSITCGYGADTSEIACHKGQWYDQHNAYMAYGPVTARALNAQWQLTAVSGIGLIHSCCGMKILMPQVYDKIDLHADSLQYIFSNYTPDLVSICLGQNDGIQDSAAFCSAYVQFVKNIRSKFPQAKILLLSSPMADANLREALKKYISSIVRYFHQHNDSEIYKFFYEKQYNKGCDGHPDLSEHQEIAALLIQFIKQKNLLSTL